MRRRDLVQLVCASALLNPTRLAAQVTSRIRRVGWVETWTLLARNDWGDIAEHLRPLGWTRGVNVHVDMHVATTPAQLPVLAREAVAAHPDLIVANGTPATLAVLAETRSIPVLFFEVADPVGNGIVGNMSHPGGNTTGFTTFEPSLGGKWLQLLKEIDPRVRRAAILFNPETAHNRASPFVREFEAVAASLMVEPILAFTQDASGIEPVLADLAAAPGGALLVLPDVFTFSQRRLIVDFAEQYRVPAIYGSRYMAATGGLLAYGPTMEGLHQGVASYMDRVLRGAKPGELPVQAPTRYELVVNLGTAKTLGLTVPPTLMAAADEVIE
ncbi:ABC transporter substrate-binding protein [Microvirga arabica]|uniref:ABC transporter substrate-binding protein n=1 Tax=Microvirga arabica TaxID=1128671 RepID=UPI00193A52CA|nr:ABC transporter substrate-binding protein [Microvirga arabica]MBM1174309.1 ABC transporter substrate-binding protein [Microvirga arabica]